MEKLLCHFVQPLPAIQGKAPKYIHLVPAGTFSGIDGRGPYVVKDMQALIDKNDGRRLPIDENHSTDFLGSLGQSAPAIGWIIGLEVREDGLWGKVKWTAKGAAMVEGEEYGFISPVFLHTEKKPYVVTELLRAGLTNDPNLTSLTALHKRKTDMNPELLALLGLEDGADDAAILAALTALNSNQTALTTALNSVRGELGIAENADGNVIIAAINALSVKPAAKDDPSVVEGLQDQIKLMSSQLTTLSNSSAKDKAVQFVDSAIADCKLVPSLRDHMISRHMKNPADVETEIGAMISLNSGGLKERKIDDSTTISATDDEVRAQMGLDSKAFAETAKSIRSVQ